MQALWSFSHFDDLFSGIERLNDFIEQRIKRTPQGVIADITDANPNDLWTVRFAFGKSDEVLVLGDQNSAGAGCIAPDVADRW